MRQGMAAFQRRDDALNAATLVEGFKRLGIGNAHVFSPARILQPCMLRANTGIIQTRGNRMGFNNLPIIALQQVGTVTMQHAWRASAQRCSMLASFNALARSFHAHQLHAIHVQVGMENTHGVRSATHTGQHIIRLLAHHGRHLLNAFATNHALEVTNQHGVWVWTRHGANNVKRVFHVRNPVAHGFVQRIFQGFGARSDRNNLGTQQLHAKHVLCLPGHIFLTHIHHTLHAITRSHSGRGHTVLARTCFRNYAGLAHALGEHGLPNAVVHFVGTCVVQVFPLEVNLCTTDQIRPALGVINGAGATHKMFQFTFKLRQKFGVVLVMGVHTFQFFQGVNQGFRHKSTAVGAEMAGGVWKFIGFVHDAAQSGFTYNSPASAFWTALQNISIFSILFMPRADSIPLDTSTP